MFASRRRFREFDRETVPGTHFIVSSFRQGPASGIYFRYQSNLLFAAPAFELFLSPDRDYHVLPTQLG